MMRKDLRLWLSWLRVKSHKCGAVQGGFVLPFLLWEDASESGRGMNRYVGIEELFIPHSLSGVYFRRKCVIERMMCVGELVGERKFNKNFNKIFIIM